MATTTAPSRPASARRTTIALKVLMAGTGLVFVGFVLLHMYGNLKLLSGEETYNTYAEHLRTFGWFSPLSATQSPIIGPSRTVLGYDGLLGSCAWC